MVDASRESHSKLFGGVILQEMLEKNLVSHLAIASLTLFATVFSVKLEVKPNLLIRVKESP